MGVGSRWKTRERQDAQGQKPLRASTQVSSLSSDAKPPAKKARKAKAKASGRGRGRGRARGTPQADADGPGTADAADALDFPDVETSAPPLAELRELGQSSCLVALWFDPLTFLSSIGNVAVCAPAGKEVGHLLRQLKCR